MFDPYHKWLGIPKGQQPPTHYQLLGVVPEETDPEVIEEMAIRQTSHVRTYQMGPHAAECARLLGEIALARRVLLDPARRRHYDAQLGDVVAAGRAPSAGSPAATVFSTAAPCGVLGAPAVDFDFEPLEAPSSAVFRRSWRRGRGKAGLLALAVTALLVGGGAAAVWRFGPGWRELSAAWYGSEPTAGAASPGVGNILSRPAAPPRGGRVDRVHP